MTTPGETAGEGVLDELKELLREYDEAQAEGFLETAFDSDQKRERTQALELGEDFEGYHILELIGEGGMGEVYLAQDRELNRKVGIKLIKIAPTAEVLRRFQNERRILANLQHPNIAQLYEARADAKGLPFFAMEYVDGTPITEFANEHQPNLTERLELFRSVCSAVSLAHQNLVVHRDLKPGNILVTEAGEPKLLDFGIAKLLEETDLEAQATGTCVMTPAYASPEQVKGQPVGTPSDIYSLGVLLYELLTGQRPYKLKNKSAAEITKAICEQEPTRPSATRGSQELGDGRRGSSPTVGEGSVAIADKSPTKIGTLTPGINPRALRGDLDNIILKALRKEPQRRYTSVEQFSEDIRRHLEGLPVSAHAGTFAYRATKFVKRNKIAVAATVLIVLTLAGGIIATTVEARRANRRFNEARQLNHTILFDYHDQIAALPGSTKVRERMVKDALKYLDNVSKDAGNDVSLLREIADGYERVAAVQGGVAMSAHNGVIISASNLGDTAGALENFHKALSIREKLASSAPNDNELRLELAYNYISIGFVHVLNGPPDQAVEYLYKGLPILEALYATDRDNEDLQYKMWNAELGLAKSLGNPAVPNIGDWPGAMALMQKWGFLIEQLATAHPDNVAYQQALAAQYNAFGHMFEGAGNQEAALQNFEKAAAIDRGLVNSYQENAFYKRELATQLGNVGGRKLDLNDRKGAIEVSKQALVIYESLLIADPNDAVNQRNAAVGYRNVGVAISTDDCAETMKNFNKALEIFAGLVAKDATNADFRRQWAYTYLALSRFQVKANDSNNAVESSQRGIKIGEELVASSPTNASARNTLALLYQQLGDSRAALGAKGSKQEWLAAKDAYQKALDIYQDLKTKGTLSGADVNKPGELVKEIAKCDAVLKSN
jgi:serine/threonine protein kinase/tetratricopeptide (TPR) repeat protein